MAIKRCSPAAFTQYCTDVKLSFKEKEALKILLKKVQGTDLEILLKESGLIE